MIKFILAIGEDIFISYGTWFILRLRYYEVIDPDEVSFTFDGILKDMYEPDNDPIILIPGIMGSELYLEKDCTTCVWPNVKETDVKDCIQNETLYVKPPAIQNNLYSNRDYCALNCMEDLVNYMCKQFPDRDVYVFNYDWRKSNKESAKSLYEFIEGLDTDSVDIVAHSMGGIVTSAYFVDYNGAKVDKVITCGTPYEGAPHCIEAIADWSVANDSWKDFFLGMKGLTKNIKSKFSGVAELVPTKNYVSKYPMWQDHKKRSTDYDYEITDFNEYQECLSKIFDSDICYKAYEFQQSLHEEGSDFNILLNYDKSYFLIGDCQYTIQAVKFDYWWDDIDDDSKLFYSFDGDGTVPLESETMMNQIKNLDRNRYKVVPYTHQGMITDECNETENSFVWMASILSDKKVIPASSFEKKPHSYMVIRIACPVEVIIKNPHGYNLNSKSSREFTAPWGRLDIIGKNGDIKYVCMDQKTYSDVILTGTGTGTMNYTVSYYSADNELIEERSFENVPLTDKTIIKAKADNPNLDILHVDKDGDGIEDETWTSKKNEVVKSPDVKESITNSTTITTSTSITTTSTTTTTTTNKSVTSTTTTAKTTTTAAATADKRIVGSWYVSHVTIKTDSYDFTDDKGVVTFNNDFTVEAKSKITMDSDGKLHENDGYWTKNGTWSIKGDKYYATPSGIQETEFIYDAASDTISVSLTDAYLVMKRGGKITSPINLGDINNDGKVNAVDASIVLTYYAMISTNKNGDFTEAQKKAADVDNNGDINAVDASYILSYYAYTSTTKEDIMSITDFMKKK